VFIFALIFTVILRTFRLVSLVTASQISLMHARNFEH
jgi:hypothetical protein